MASSSSDHANVARFLTEASKNNSSACALRSATGRDSDGSIRYESLNFTELDHWSAEAVSIFQYNGIQRGDRVLLMVRPGLELIACVFALFRLGAPPVVIDPGMGLKSFLRCVERSKPDALVGIPLAHLVRRIRPRAFRSVRSGVKVGPTFSRALRTNSSPVSPIAQTSQDELAAILFTSGSTGPAKGVCYTHGMFEAQVRMIRKAFEIQPGEVDLPMLPVFALFNPALGMATVVPEMNPSRPAKADPAKIVQAIQQNAVTNSFGSPVLWTNIVRYCEQAGETLPSLKRVLMAGAPASPELIRRLKALMPNGEVHTPYGATEVLPVSSISGSDVLSETAGLTVQGKGTCVGKPLSGVTVCIIPINESPITNRSHLTELPTGVVGEIIATGPSVTRQYDQLPEATAQAKIEDDNGCVWHRMGDLGYLDDEGRLWFCGRMAERVETENGLLYTDCVEGIFNRHEKVFRTALLGLGKRPGQHPVLAVEPFPGHWPKSQADRQTFIQEMKAIAQEHEMTRQISDFRFVKKFPVDVRHNAKIHRLALAKRFDSQ